MVLRYLIFLVLVIPRFSLAHPGIGIVKDSKGNIYYTDLQKVWKISNGERSVLLEGLHTHELYIDKHDNLFGEHVIYYPSDDIKWRHFLWRLSPEGKLDTVVGLREAYAFFDYSLARDAEGNEYYTRNFMRNRDSVNIYKHYPDGTEIIFATGNFNGVSWLHPQKDGSLFYVKDNDVYKVTAEGITIRIAEDISSSKPSFPLTGNNIVVYGVWQDDSSNAYVAAFSDQSVKRIDRNGNITVVHQSSGNWAPLHGVFDNDGRLWVMESSDKNEVRVVQVSSSAPLLTKEENFSNAYWLVPLGLLLVVGVLFWRRSGRVERDESDRNRM